MVSNQQNMNHVGIDKFLHALWSLNVKKDDISGEQLKIKYINVALNSTQQSYLTLTKYEDDEANEDKEIVRPLSQ